MKCITCRSDYIELGNSELKGFEHIPIVGCPNNCEEQTGYEKLSHWNYRILKHTIQKKPTPILIEEEWKEIPGYEGYYACSTLGQIKSLDRFIEGKNRWGVYKRLYPGKMLIQSTKDKGYKQISLSKEGDKQEWLIHDLVLLTFVGPKSKNEEINHLDGNPSNNYLNNIEYCSHQDNEIHKRKILGHQRGENHWKAKLTEEQVLIIKNSHDKSSLLAKQYQIDQSTILDIQKGRTWKYLDEPEYEVYYGLHEVYYNEDGSICSYTEHPIAYGDTHQEVLSVLRQMLHDAETHSVRKAPYDEDIDETKEANNPSKD